MARDDGFLDAFGMSLRAQVEPILVVIACRFAASAQPKLRRATKPTDSGQEQQSTQFPIHQTTDQFRVYAPIWRFHFVSPCPFVILGIKKGDAN